MTYDASNRKDIRRAEKLTDQLATDNLQFLRAMMDTVPGRRWVYHHLAECQTFVDVPTFEPYHDYFSAGRRSIGLRLMADLLTHCPTQYNQMLGEEHVRLSASAPQRPGSQDLNGGASGRDETDADFDGDFNQ